MYRAGVLVRVADETWIVVNSRDKPQFVNVLTGKVVSDSAPVAKEEAVWFTKWSLVSDDGRSLITLFEFSLEE